QPFRAAAASRRRRLTSSILAAIAFGAPAAASATTWTIDSCTDASSGNAVAHTGSLRFAAANAASGDTLDLGALPTTYACSTISLQTGAITFGQADMTLKGNAATRVTISGRYTKNNKTYSDNDRVLRHNGVGTLRLYDLTVADGN